MLRIFIITLLAAFTLTATDWSCYENYETYQKCKIVKKVIKQNRGDVPDYVFKDAAKGYLERPSKYQINQNEEWLFYHSDFDEKRKRKHHD